VILDGYQPRDLTAEKLLKHSRLPLGWHDQRSALGFTLARSEPKNHRCHKATDITGGAVLEYGSTETLPPLA
jgi:hypothetical protein